MLLEPELTELQRQLAQIDLLTKPRRRAQPDFIELLLLKLRHLKIKIYQETGHQIPHVHVGYGREHHVTSYSQSRPGSSLAIQQMGLEARRQIFISREEIKGTGYFSGHWQRLKISPEL